MKIERGKSKYGRVRCSQLGPDSRHKAKVGKHVTIHVGCSHEGWSDVGFKSNCVHQTTSSSRTVILYCQELSLVICVCVCPRAFASSPLPEWVHAILQVSPTDTAILMYYMVAAEPGSFETGPRWWPPDITVGTKSHFWRNTVWPV